MNNILSDYLDPNFGDDGVIAVGLKEQIGGKIARRHDGAFLITGSRGSNKEQGSSSARVRKTPWDDNFLDDHQPVNRLGNALLTVKLTAEGVLDTTYGEYGYAELPYFGHPVTPGAAVVLPDDSVIMAMFLHDLPNPDHASLCILKILADGSQDTTFGTNGIFRPDLKYPWAEGSHIVLTNDKKILITTRNIRGFDDSTWVLMQIDTDGKPDREFGTGGFVYGLAGWQFYGVSVSPKGNIYLPGAYKKDLAVPHVDMAVFCYTQSGTISTDFGEQGLFTYTLTPQSEATAIELGEEAVYIAAHTAPDSGLLFLKLTMTGEMDPDYNGGRPLSLQLAGKNFYCDELFIRRSGKTVAAATTFSEEGKLTLTQINQDGTVDNYFGYEGTVYESIEGHLSYDFGELVDDKLLVAGTLVINRPGEGTSFWIAQYLLGTD